MKARGQLLEHFGLRLTASAGSEPPLGRFGRRPGVCKLDFYAFCLETRDLYNSMSFCSGSATFASPGAQVGGTWAQKSDPGGRKLQVRGPRAINFGKSLRSCWQATFASPGAQIGATWAQKSEPNGPKLEKTVQSC